MTSPTSETLGFLSLSPDGVEKDRHTGVRQSPSGIRNEGVNTLHLLSWKEYPWVTSHVLYYKHFENKVTDCVMQESLSVNKDNTECPIKGSPLGVGEVRGDRGYTDL